MPFTFSHAAAVVPVFRTFRHYTVLSALIIGSMVPDFHYFLPFDADRADSHSPAGIVWFCMPVGMALYLFFHLLLKRPMLSLCPPSAAPQFYALYQSCVPLPRASGLSVAASLFIGILTHLVWDALTHYSFLTVFILPFLSTYLFSIGSYHVYLYKLLQHASSVAGAVLLWVWIRNWLRTAPTLEPPAGLTFSESQRQTILALLLAAPPVAGAWLAFHASSISYEAMGVKEMVRETVIAGLSTFGFLCFAYSVIWHLFFSPPKSN